MKIVNTLTLRHIKTHKKRSILTILAIIVSVAMVTAVFTSALSFVEYFKNVTVAIDGDYHAYVHTDDYLKYKDKFNTPDIDKYGIDLWYGSADVDNDPNSFEMNINAVDKNYLDIRNVQITKGEMPKTANEIVVTQAFVEKHSLDWQIGKIISLPILVEEGKSEKRDFKIVGITESKVAETDYVDGFVFATDDLIKDFGDTSVYVHYKNVDKTIFGKVSKLSESVMTNSEAVSFGYHTELLMYEGVDDNGTMAVLYSFCAIILVIIAIVSIFMIYDSFAVSYQERARYLGMLASVGATKKQKRNSIYFEGLILGLIGIPFGILAGIGGIAITFRLISDTWIDTLAVEYNGALTVAVNWLVILGTVIASAITIFVSSYIPARKASKTTAIDAIRQANTVKVKKKKIKTSKLATKLLGYEGALAVKNFKRNGKRSTTIVFSLILSVVVFVSVTNFSMMFADVMRTNLSEQADATITASSDNAQKFDKILASANGVDEYFCTAELYADIDSSIVKDENKDNVTQFYLIFVDNNTIDSYAKQLDVDAKQFHNEKKPAGILHNSMLYNHEDTQSKINPIIDVQGKDITLSTNVWNEEKVENDKLLSTVNVGAQTAENWKNDKFGIQNWHTPQMIFSIDLIDKIIGEDNIEGYTAYITTEDSETVLSDIESLMNEQNVAVLSSYDASAQMKSMNNILKIAAVFIYGFISLITLISIMNIINTISNSMNERRREFAMIRSVGMTPKSFKKMVYYESFRYGLVSLLWSIPISVAIHILLYKVLANSYNYGIVLHPLVYISAIVAVFVIIGIAILYSTTKIKKDNIIETLKQDIN